MSSIVDIKFSVDSSSSLIHSAMFHLEQLQDSTDAQIQQGLWSMMSYDDIY